MICNAETEKLALKFTWTIREPLRAKTILKKNKTEALTLPDFKTQYKATVIKTVQGSGQDGEQAEMLCFLTQPKEG